MCTIMEIDHIEDREGEICTGIKPLGLPAVVCRFSHIVTHIHTTRLSLTS